MHYFYMHKRFSQKKLRKKIEKIKSNISVYDFTLNVNGWLFFLTHHSVHYCVLHARDAVAFNDQGYFDCFESML